MAAEQIVIFLSLFSLVFADDEQLCNIKDANLNGKVFSAQNLNPYASMFIVPVLPNPDVDPLCTFFLCPNGTQTFLLCQKTKPVSAVTSSRSRAATSTVISGSSSESTFQPADSDRHVEVMEMAASTLYPRASARSLYGQGSPVNPGSYGQPYSRSLYGQAGLSSSMPSSGIPMAVTAALNTYYLYGPKLPLSIKFSLCDSPNNGPTTFAYDQFGPTSNKMLFGLANTLVTSLAIECLNPMFVTKSGLLEDLINLKMLDIKFTQPTATDFTSRNVLVLPNGAFAGAKSLESIRLDFQSSKVRLNSSVFDGLPNLRCLEMAGRNFDCTYCPLQDLLANSTFMRPDMNNGSYYANPYLPGDIMSCGQYREAFCDGAFNRSIITATPKDCQVATTPISAVTSDPLDARMMPLRFPFPLMGVPVAASGSYPNMNVLGVGK